MTWRKSSFSATAECVEVSLTGDRVWVRNSRVRGGVVLEVSRVAVAAFVAGCGAGEFS